MHKLILSLALFTLPLAAAPVPAPQDCCKTKDACCPDTCCKVADHCCKADMRAACTKHCVAPAKVKHH